MVVHICYLCVLVDEVGRTEAQGHPWLCNKLQANLGYERYYLKINE